MSQTTDTPGSLPTGPTDETFFQRFSRRKHEARQGRADATVEQDNRIDTPPAATTINTDAPSDRIDRLTDADMPDLESLDESSDYTGFLSAKVSETLRRAALRKLFHSTAFNFIDELDDYNEDFTAFEGLGDIVTAEMRHRDEIERRRELEAQVEEAGDGDAVVAEPDGIDDRDGQAAAAAPSKNPTSVDKPGESDADKRQLEGTQDDSSSARV